MSPKVPYSHWNAQKMTEQLSAKELSVNELLQTCLQRIRFREKQVQAWTYLDLDRAKDQATQWEQVLTTQGSDSLETYPLLGIPIAVKDVFATLGMPTAWGTQIYQNRYLDYEATVVTMLKSAGAIILGKTVTTDLATATAGPTTNPHQRAHTPGGSSSGSAAAVADGMVPIAIGSQTMGSILRPAAYCGVFGFKPSFGLISRYGMMPVAQQLDHVGVFSRNLADIQRLLTVLVQPDVRDSDCLSSEQLASIKQPSEDRDRPLRLGLIQTPYWSEVEQVARNRLMQAIDVLRQTNITIEQLLLPNDFDGYWNVVQKLCARGLYQNHGSLLTESPEHCSPLLTSWLKRGQAISDATYQEVCLWQNRYRRLLTPIFAQYDAIISPVTTGPAPFGLENTGSPIFCGLWTLCGLPALNIPLGKTEDELPLGCQLVGALYSDQQLLAVAHQIWDILRTVFGEIMLPET